MRCLTGHDTGEVQWKLCIAVGGGLLIQNVVISAEAVKCSEFINSGAVQIRSITRISCHS